MTDNYAIQARQAQQRFLTYDQQAIQQKLHLDGDAHYLYPTMLSRRYRLNRATGNLEAWSGDTWADANTFDEIMTLLDLLCDSRPDRFLTGRWKNMAAFGAMFHPWSGDTWADANTFDEIMTLLDLLCDSRPDRFLTGRWKNMAAFGAMFHQNLLENPRDPWANRIQQDPQGFSHACLALGGRALPMGDIAYAVELFDQNLLENPRDPWANRIQQDPQGFSHACLALGGRALPMGDIAYAVELFDGLEIALQFWFSDEDFPPTLRFSWDENAGMYLKYETMFYAKGLLWQRLEEVWPN